MKKWRCTVCNYVHTGDEPPESCPVCGADKSLFELLTDEGEGVGVESKSEPALAKASETASGTPSGPAAMKWRCTVCGYIHEGPEPPENCPVCGADRSLFEPIYEERPQAEEEADAEQIAQDATEAGESRFGETGEMIIEQMLKHHIHPVSVHIPNGVIPFSFLFIIFGIFFGAEGFATAARCNMLFVLLTLPVVIFSGYMEWQRRYNGAMTSRFKTKIVCAGIVAALTLIIVLWWTINPDIASPRSSGNVIFLFLNAVLLGAAAVAGYIGGKFVFRD